MGMGKRKVPMNSGDEYDALTRWRKCVKWGKGEVARIKRKFRRRERRASKKELKQ